MLNPDFTEMLVALSEEGAEYLLVGAFAVAAHGAPRATGDLDILVRPSRENALKVWRALRRWGAPLRDVTPADFESTDLIYQIGLVPSRIDVITGISGVEFDDAWRGRITIAFKGMVLPFIGLVDLIRNKTASGRPKDLVDVETLRQLAESSKTRTQT